MRQNLKGVVLVFANYPTDEASLDPTNTYTFAPLRSLFLRSLVCLCVFEHKQNTTDGEYKKQKVVPMALAPNVVGIRGTQGESSRLYLQA